MSVVPARGALLAALGLFGLAAPSVAWGQGEDRYADKAPQAKDIISTAAAAGQFKTLAAALETAGLVETLKGKGPFTVFAPTDAAFARIPQADLDALLADKARLSSVLRYHVVSGKISSKDVARLKSAKSLEGGELWVDAKDGVKIGGAKVIQTDLAASNGVIHAIDAVLTPPARAATTDKPDKMEKKEMQAQD